MGKWRERFFFCGSLECGGVGVMGMDKKLKGESRDHYAKVTLQKSIRDMRKKK